MKYSYIFGIKLWTSYWLKQGWLCTHRQGANERNEFFEKPKKKKPNKFRRTRQRSNNLRDELIWGWTPSGGKGWCFIAPKERYNAYVFFQCPDSVVWMLSKLLCVVEKWVLYPASFAFAQNTVHNFQITVLNSQWHCLRQKPPKPFTSRGTDVTISKVFLSAQSLHGPCRSKIIRHVRNQSSGQWQHNGQDFLKKKKTYKSTSSLKFL